MSGIGLVNIPQKTGRPVQLQASDDTIWKPVGVTLAWELAAVALADKTLADGTQIRIGEQYFEIGTPMVMVTKGEVTTITIDATGGTFKITVTRDGVARTTGALAWNATAAVVQAALQALSNVGDGRVTVALAGLVYTLTFNPQLGNIAVATDPALLTGGAGTAAAATTSEGSASGGKYAEFDSSQNDGRQILTRGDVGLLNVTLKKTELGVLGGGALLNTELTGLIEGGLMYRRRLRVGGVNQATLAQLLAVLPELRLTPMD